MLAAAPALVEVDGGEEELVELARVPDAFVLVALHRAADGPTHEPRVDLLGGGQEVGLLEEHGIGPVLVERHGGPTLHQPSGRLGHELMVDVVADAQRILTRGGVYLYPRDPRPGYENGRLRLLYEAAPLAFLVEQAGGKAFDGRTRILDLVPSHIHQRTPLILGSPDEVDHVVARLAEAG